MPPVTLFRCRHRRRVEQAEVEIEQARRLVWAEGELARLKERAERAIGLLDDRRAVNQFAETFRMSLKGE